MTRRTLRDGPLPATTDAPNERLMYQGTPRVRLRKNETADGGSVRAVEAHAVDCQMGQCRGVDQADLVAPLGARTWSLSAPCMRLVKHYQRLRERSERRENRGERSEPPG